MCFSRGLGKKARRQSEGNPADTLWQKQEEIDTDVDWHFFPLCVFQCVAREDPARKTGQYEGNPVDTRWQKQEEIDTDDDWEQKLLQVPAHFYSNKSKA